MPLTCKKNRLQSCYKCCIREVWSTMPDSPAAQRIKTAYLDLLEKYPGGPITVTQIAQRAHVNRVTFYRLYSTLEDVLLDILDEFDRRNREYLGGIPFDEIDDEETVKLMLEHHRRNMHMLRAVLKSSMAPVLERRIEKGISGPAMARSDRIEGFSHLLMSYYTAGISATICEWIKGGCEESVDVVMSILRRTAL